MLERHYLIEVDAHDGTDEITLYFGTVGFTTRPDDDPANQWFDPRVQNPGFLNRALFALGTTTGQSQIGYGEIILANADGGLDDLIGYGFDGRRCEIKVIDDPDAAYSEATTVFKGTVEQVDGTDAWAALRLRLYDRLVDLDVPLQDNLYAGTTNSGGASAAGTVDLRDSPKPLSFGRVFNVPAVPVNPFDLIYQVHDGEVSSITVYDAGVPLSYAGNSASLSALQSATITPGQYRTCRALGLFRLGGAPYKVVTADVVEGSSSFARTAPQIVKRMLAKIGETDIDDDSFTALSTLNSAECGVFIDAEMSVLSATRAVLDSIGGWLIPDAFGTLKVGRLSAPSGDPVLTLTEDMILGPRLAMLATGDQGRGVPAWRVFIKYRRVWQRQDDNDLAHCLDTDTRGFLGREWRDAKVEDGSVRTKHLLSPELSFDTCLADLTDAEAEAIRRLVLYGTRRLRFQATVPAQLADDVGLGDVVRLQLPRFGLSEGRDFVVIGLEDQRHKNTVTLDIWG